MIIKESNMEFGEFASEDVFQMEHSKLHASFGDGIKTVEFVLLKDDNKILFVEAKTTCPNRDNRYESEEKAEKFEEYFEDISDKFIDSLQMMLNAYLQRNKYVDGIGNNLMKQGICSKVKFCFVLVIKNADNEEWLAGPKEELEMRLLRWRKLWNVNIAVLNEKLAVKYGLIK